MATKKFLQRVSLEDARAQAARTCRLTASESVPAGDAFGRVTAEPVYAVFSAPHYRASAMDGIAVRAADTAPAATSPLTLTECEEAGAAAPQRPCRVVDTGNPLPDWADAVVRIEDVERTGSGFRIGAPVAPGRDVRRIGEDIDAGTRLLPRGHEVRAFDIGAMLATGVSEVLVRKRPAIGVVATGSEIVEPGGTPQTGKVIEYNSRVLAGFAVEWGATTRYLGRVEDTPQAMSEVFRRAAAEHDIVCVIAGSSAGRKDFTVDVLSEIGELSYHGVDMMPGRPAAFATVAGTPVLGIPGYPVSAVVAYRELLEPMVAACLGRSPFVAETIRAEVRRKIPSKLGAEEFLRVALAQDGEEFVAALLPRGAGSVSTLVRADGILRIGPNSEGVEPGASVAIELLRPRAEIGKTVVVAGSPDSVTTRVEDLCRAAGGTMRMTHLGLGGLDAVDALHSGEAQVAILSQDDPDVVELLNAQPGRCSIFPIAETAETKPHAFIAMPARFADSPVGREILAAIEKEGEEPK
jgi:putative molybdopterin biosynthesis protein